MNQPLFNARLRLAFLTDTQMPVNLSIPRAAMNLTSETVDNAMDEIILSGIYDTRNRGNLANKIDANLIFTESIHFDVSDY